MTTRSDKSPTSVLRTPDEEIKRASDVDDSKDDCWEIVGKRGGVIDVKGSTENLSLSDTELKHYATLTQAARTKVVSLQERGVSYVWALFAIFATLMLGLFWLPANTLDNGDFSDYSTIMSNRLSSSDTSELNGDVDGESPLVSPGYGQYEECCSSGQHCNDESHRCLGPGKGPVDALVGAVPAMFPCEFEGNAGLFRLWTDNPERRPSALPAWFDVAVPLSLYGISSLSEVDAKLDPQFVGLCHSVEDKFPSRVPMAAGVEVLPPTEGPLQDEQQTWTADECAISLRIQLHAWLGVICQGGSG